MKERMVAGSDRIGDLPRDTDDPRTITDLLKELSSEAGTLARQEVELAKTEMSEKLNVYTRNLLAMGLGGAVLLAALLAFLAAVNRGLTALFAQWMDLEIAIWLAPLVLAVILGVIGWSLVKKARTAMAREGVVPRKTVATLKEEKQWIATRLK